MQMRCHTGGGDARSWLSHRAHSPPCSPGPRRPAGSSALQPQRGTAASIQQPALRHFSCTRSHRERRCPHSQTRQQHTHKQTTSREAMRNGSPAPPFTGSTTKHSLRTIRSLAPAEDLQQPLSTLASRRSAAPCRPPWEVQLPAHLQTALAKPVTPAWRGEDRLGRQLGRQVVFFSISTIRFISNSICQRIISLYFKE